MKQQNTTLKLTEQRTFEIENEGTSLVAQWLRLGAFTAGGAGLIPGWGTKIPQASQGTAKNKKMKLKMTRNAFEF